MLITRIPRSLRAPVLMPKGAFRPPNSHAKIHIMAGGPKRIRTIDLHVKVRAHPATLSVWTLFGRQEKCRDGKVYQCMICLMTLLPLQ